MPMEELFALTRTTTVAQLLERDDFAKRYAGREPISITELLYPLMQAYDSVAVRADVELGGTDQKFNLLLGRDVQRAYGIDEQVALTMPILPGVDGERKMSKSLGNHIGVTDAPEEMYGKTLSLPDAAMASWYELLLGEPLPAGLSPRDAKHALARRLVERLHSRRGRRGRRRALRARRSSRATCPRRSRRRRSSRRTARRPPAGADRRRASAARARTRGASSRRARSSSTAPRSAPRTSTRPRAARRGGPAGRQAPVSGACAAPPERGLRVAGARAARPVRPTDLSILRAAPVPAPRPEPFHGPLGSAILASPVFGSLAISMKRRFQEESPPWERATVFENSTACAP